MNPFPCHQAHPFRSRPKSLAEIPILGYPTDRNQAQHFSGLCFYTWPSPVVAAGGEFRSWYGDSSFSSFGTELSRSRNRKPISHDCGTGSLVSALAMNRGNTTSSAHRRNLFSQHNFVFLNDFFASITRCLSIKLKKIITQEIILTELNLLYICAFVELDAFVYLASNNLPTVCTGLSFSSRSIYQELSFFQLRKLWTCPKFHLGSLLREFCSLWSRILECLLVLLDSWPRRRCIQSFPVKKFLPHACIFGKLLGFQ